MVRSKVATHVRDRVLIGTTLFALGHAGYVMSGDSSMGAGS